MAAATAGTSPDDDPDALRQGANAPPRPRPCALPCAAGTRGADEAVGGAAAVAGTLACEVWGLRCVGTCCLTEVLPGIVTEVSPEVTPASGSLCAGNCCVCADGLVVCSGDVSAAATKVSPAPTCQGACCVTEVSPDTVTEE